MPASCVLAPGSAADSSVTVPTHPAISVIAVTWNSEGQIGPFLASVSEGAHGLPGGVEVIVVDNCSVDGTRDEVEVRGIDIKLIVTHRNIGYGGAANVGLAAASGETLVVSNPDVTFEPGALRAFHERLVCDADVGCVAPTYVTAGGDTEWPGRRFPTIGVALVDGTMMDRWLGASAVLRRYYLDDARDVDELDWAHGACLAFRATAIRSVGGFDSSYFMYAEELDLLRSLRDEGWRCAIEPHARIHHVGGHTADGDTVMREKNFFRSRYRLATKVWGSPFAVFLRIFVAVIGLARLAEAVLKLVLRRDRGNRLPEICSIARVTLWHWLGWRR